jgi:hypothetical protein
LREKRENQNKKKRNGKKKLALINSEAGVYDPKFFSMQV